MTTLYPETEDAGIEDLERHTNWEHWSLHGLTVTAFDIPGLPVPLSFLPVHFTPFAPCHQRCHRDVIGM
ncbi:hypothetical protein [Streptomyces sp. NPDC004232]|uniref:hypothetical protein n=1 Tax=unclassified Streptomyces TaxID=2593676 RepID=UPI001E09A444|nr:hypothetical protein [Streptomyces sp. tea 10]